MATTSYENSGGSGDRSALIVVSNSDGLFYPGFADSSKLVDGVDTGNITAFNNVSAVGHWIKFDFGVGASKIIDEATWYQEGSYNEGVWKWQGSDDDSEWFDIGSSFTLGGSSAQVQTELSENTTGYRYYQLVAVSGSVNWLPSLHEIEFKIDDADPEEPEESRKFIPGVQPPTIARLGRVYNRLINRFIHLAKRGS